MRRWLISLGALTLAILGLVMLKSIAPDLVLKQTGFVSVGILIVIAFQHFSNQRLLIGSSWAYWGLMVLLLWLLLIGTQTRGTAGWFELGWGLKFQPSQLAVPIVAGFLLRYAPITRSPLTGLALIKVLSLLLLPAVLIGLEPDFGTMMVYLVSLGSLLLWYPIPKKIWLVGVASAIAALCFAWFFLFQPYQKDRILSFLSPADELAFGVESSAAYNARQAMIAVGSGGFFGRGLGYGIQSHLRFLPEKQTDFIFAALAEELGLLGSLLVVGLLPITGITLPFVSYGGSSLLGMSVALGSALAVSGPTKRTVSLRIQ
jgi:rod shape determining protein RodA